MTDPTELIERIARAICGANCRSRNATDEETECQVANGWDLWVPEAHAIIPIITAEREAGRGARYGDFTDHARIADALHAIVIGDTPVGKFNTSWGVMKPFQRQALRVIVDKLARILNGDPDYIDNWHDIQGYAKLAEERLK